VADTEAKKHGWNEEVWATAIALIYLKEKFKNRVDSWELVDRKARQWIQTNFGLEPWFWNLLLTDPSRDCSLEYVSPK